MAADPKTQGMFDQTVRQGLQAVTDEAASKRVAQDAQARGPEAAIVEAVVQALQGVKQSAERSGIQLPPDVLQAAAVAIAQVMVSMMIEAGMAENPDELLRAVVTQLKGA